VTDCNVMQGYSRVSFPRCLADDLPLDASVVHQKFAALVKEIGDNRTSEQVASVPSDRGRKMASAIKRYPFSAATMFRYTFALLLGERGQHACLIADWDEAGCSIPCWGVISHGMVWQMCDDGNGRKRL